MASFEDFVYRYAEKNTVTEEKLIEWETEMGIKIPQQYREFLLFFKDGGVFLRQSAYFPLGDYYGDGREIHKRTSFFFTTLRRKDKPAFDLAWQFSTTREGILDWLLPFTNDAAGGYICIAHKGKNKGKIYYWDDDYYAYDHPELEIEPRKFLASSFKEFVEKIQFEEDE